MKPKQLTWRNGRAETPFGAYRTGKLGHRWWFGSSGESSNFYRTEKAAQAAAQADFERRLRQCFEGNDNG